MSAWRQLREGNQVSQASTIHRTAERRSSRNLSIAPVLWAYGPRAVGSVLGITVIFARRINRRMSVLAKLVILEAFERREQDGQRFRSIAAANTEIGSIHSQVDFASPKQQ